jgi:RNA chaperone Hfq
MEKNFLEQVQGHNSPTTIFLTNGIKLQGRMVGYDDHTIALKRDGVTQLAYKTAIATIMPSDYIELDVDGNC